MGSIRFMQLTFVGLKLVQQLLVLNCELVRF